MTEPDMVTIGSNSCVDNASLIAHINTRGVFKYVLSLSLPPSLSSLSSPPLCPCLILSCVLSLSFPFSLPPLSRLSFGLLYLSVD
jgi:hypothetical protein